MAEPITVNDRAVSTAEVKGTCSGGRLPYARGRRSCEFAPTQVTAYYRLTDDGWRLFFVSVKGPIVRQDGQLGGQFGWATFGGRLDGPVPGWLRPWVERNNPGRQPAVAIEGGVSGG